MSEIDQDLDRAADRLKDGTPDPNPKRTKDPEYAVFRQCDENADGSTLGAELSDPNTYLLITQQVKASSRREAIKAATGKLEEGLRSVAHLRVPVVEQGPKR
jgi:hypothetical protein